MSQPIVPPNRPADVPRVSRSILRRLARVDVSHDFDVIGDAPPPRAGIEQAAQAAEQAAPRAAE